MLRHIVLYKGNVKVTQSMADALKQIINHQSHKGQTGGVLILVMKSSIRIKPAAKIPAHKKGQCDT